MNTDFNARIFVSYAHEDEASAIKLYDSLRSDELLQPWIDREDLLPGQKWRDAVLDALDESRFVVLLLSQSSISERGFVQGELAEALESLLLHPPDSLYLIPARLQECHPKDRLLREIQWIDLFPHWRIGILEIAQAFWQHLETELEQHIDSIKAKLEASRRKSNQDSRRLKNLEGLIERLWRSHNTLLGDIREFHERHPDVDVNETDLKFARERMKMHYKHFRQRKEQRASAEQTDAADKQ